MEGNHPLQREGWERSGDSYVARNLELTLFADTREFCVCAESSTVTYWVATDDDSAFGEAIALVAEASHSDLEARLHDVDALPGVGVSYEPTGLRVDAADLPAAPFSGGSVRVPGPEADRPTAPLIAAGWEALSGGATPCFRKGAVDLELDLDDPTTPSFEISEGSASYKFWGQLDDDDFDPDSDDDIDGSEEEGAALAALVDVLCPVTADTLVAAMRAVRDLPGEVNAVPKELWSDVEDDPTFPVDLA